MTVELRVQEPDEIVHARAGLSNNRPKRSTTRRSMVGYDCLGERIIAAHQT